jgi:chromate transporter
MTDIRPHDGPPQISLTALFLKFLRFGALAFGGPVAQIAMLRQTLVEEERWIDSARFNRLLAVMQVLPGPEAHELAVHLGIVARGRVGGMLAGLGFMLPGFLLMMAAAWLYQRFAGALSSASILLGVQIVVIAIIVRAVHRIGLHVIENVPLAIFALAGFALSLLHAPFWVALLVGGVGHSLSRRTEVAIAIAAGAIVAAGLLFGWGQAADPVVLTSQAAPATMVGLFVAGLKGGLLTFGGAYTAIPYVRTDTVGRGWLTDGTFLDGVAIGGLLPAPLVIFATFVGFVVGGFAGAVAITLGMFLPAFAFSLIFYERLEAVIENAAVHRLLSGIAAAVVGIIAATCVQLGWAVAARANDLAVAAVIFTVAVIVAYRVKGAIVLPALVAGGALAGWLLQP